SYDVTVATHNAKRLCMTGHARIGIGPGNALQVPRKQQPLRRLGKRSARALGEWPPPAFLIRPNRREYPAAVLDELWHGKVVFLSVLQVPWHTYFAPNLRDACLGNANPRAKR